MVKKLEKGSIVQNSCNLVYKSREVKPQTKKRNLAHVKCFKCSNMGHYASMCSIKIEGQQTLSKRQRSLAKRRYFGCCKMGHRIATCPDKLGKPGSSEMRKLEVPALKSQRHFRPNKGFKKAQEKYLERKAVKGNKNNQLSNIKHKVCYTCREKGHLVRIVQTVTLLSQIWPTMYLYAIGDIQMVLVLVGWWVHQLLAQKPFGSPNLCWLTFMDPTWLGYQNVLERISRYSEMHCGLGEYEKSFTSISLSKVHLENRQVELKLIHHSNASPVTRTSSLC